MKYVDEFRDVNITKRVIEKINKEIKMDINIMEVCGTHTMAIYKHGIDKLLPSNIKLISGPGCPVCVTDINYIDNAINLSKNKNVIICTFGDMIRITGSKSSLNNEKAKGVAYNVLYTVLTTGLQLLHPAMPYITEEIYTTLTNGESIAISNWPECNESLVDAKAVKDMDYIIESIKGLRNLRAEMNVPPSRKAKVICYISNEAKDAFTAGIPYIEKLGSASEVEFIADKALVPENAVSLVDKDKELERLGKEKTKLEGEITRIEKKLSNQGFVAKAPEAVVEGEKAKMAKYQEMLDAVLVRIEAFK